jgi:hypothetical protein
MRPLVPLLLVGLLLPVLASAGFPDASSASSTYRTASHVRGYLRKDGTYVRPHERHDSATSPWTSTRRPRERAPVVRSHETIRDGNGILRDEHGRIARSESARDAFLREHPCPCTGRTSGPCPGYVVDHIRALKHGGADSPSNMQWQTVEAAKAKDRIE